MSFPIFPQIAPSDCTISLVTPSQLMLSPLKTYSHYQSLSLDYWSLHLIWKYLPKEDYLQLISFLDDTGNHFGKFCFRTGFLTGRPIRQQGEVFSASGKKILILREPPAPPGSLLSFVDNLGISRLHRMTASRYTGTKYEIRLVPHLRSGVDAGTPIEWQEPKGTFFLTQRPYEVFSAGLGVHFEIKIQEALR